MATSQTFHPKAAPEAAPQVKPPVGDVGADGSPSDGALTVRPPEGLRGSREEEPPSAREEEPPSARRRSEMEHYLKLKRSVGRSDSLKPDAACFPADPPALLLSQGWLQDRSGRWVKDQNVEFDSDEEEPPPPPPPPSAPPASH